MPIRLSIARQVSFDSFTEVMERSKEPGDVSDKLYKKKAHLVRESHHRLDRRFVKELLFGSLRWYKKIYWILQNTSKIDLKKCTPEVRSALILGAYQIFYMDRVPDRAAVNESVEYVRSKGQAGAVRYVNGVLRSIARRAEYFSKPDKEKQPGSYLALQYAHPGWLVDRWLGRFGFEKTKSMLSANNQHAPYTVRLNTVKIPQGTVQDFRSRLLREEKNRSDRKGLRTCLHLKDFPNLESKSLFQQGYYCMQDEASQLVSALVDPKPKDIIIDACAGKGVKTSHLLELSQGEANIVAVDVSAKQIEFAKENLERLGHKPVFWVEKDFRIYNPKGRADKILIDAPCSALGVLRRHPEAKWLKTRSIIDDLSKLQRELLRHGFELLKPGGELVFSVCSFEAEESVHQLQWILSEFKDKIEVVSPHGRLPSCYNKYITRDKLLAVYAGNADMMDGFSAFICKKISN